MVVVRLTEESQMGGVAVAARSVRRGLMLVVIFERRSRVVHIFCIADCDRSLDACQDEDTQPAPLRKLADYDN